MNEKEELQYLKEQVRKLKQENRELSSKLAITEASKAETEENLSKIKNSFAWKMAKPLRVVRAGFVRLSDYKTPKNIMSKAEYKRRLKKAYVILGTNSFPDEANRKAEEDTRYETKITFSVLVPLYNTPEKFLRDMIDSVRTQTYKDWDLCRADGYDQEHAYVGVIGPKYAADDERI